MESPNPARPYLSRLSQLLLLTCFYLAVSFIWTIILTLIIPARMETFFEPAVRGRYEGMLYALGSVVSAIAQLAIGFLSDSSASRFGRRKPFLAFGAAASIFTLAFLMGASGYWEFLIAYLLVQVSVNTASVPFQSMMPDLVRQDHHGRAAALIGINDLVGKLAATLAFSLVGYIGFTSGRALSGFNYSALTYIFGILLIVLAAVVLVTAPSYPVDKLAGWFKLRFGGKGFLKPFREFTRFEFRKYPDFIRLILVRFSIQIGFYTLITQIYHFAATNLGVGEDRRWLAALLTAAVVVGGVPGNIIGGKLSDTIGKRTTILLGLAVTSAFLIPIIFIHSFTLACALGFFLGFGYGAYIAGDWGIGFTLIPKDRTARYMALYDMAALGSLALAGATVGPIHDALIIVMPEYVAYRVIFSYPILFFAIGLIILRYVREPRKQAEAAESG